MIDSTWGWSVKEQVLKLLCDNCVTYSSRLLRKSAGASISMLVENCYIHYCVVVTTKLRYLEQYLGCRGRPYLWQIAKEYTTPPIWVHRDEFIGLFYYIIQHNAFAKKLIHVFYKRRRTEFYSRRNPMKRPVTHFPTGKPLPLSEYMMMVRNCIPKYLKISCYITGESRVKEILAAQEGLRYHKKWIKA